jgi:hypothetical protein
MIITSIVVVLLVSALIGLAAWRFLKSVENLQANPAKLRRRFILLAVIYCLGTITAINEVLQHRAPAISLLGLPIGLYFVWLYLRAAASLKSVAK